ncbi:MAG: hypothetical protein IT449_11700 [Phycisphaerales bacterium]|nr:hypothetical protein [Phycisphaerales bacterium]
MFSKRTTVGTALSALLLSLSAASAQWQGGSLHPDGANKSDGLAAAGRQQGGGIEVFGEFIYYWHPVVWNARRNAYIDLLPEGWDSGLARSVSAAYRAGYFQVLNERHAALWVANDGSFRDLSPGPDYSASDAFALSGDQQAGTAHYFPTASPHAALWQGNQESFVDMHPSGTCWSEGYATDGTYQGGRLDVDEQGGGIHAALWRGSADSFVDMNPDGCLESVIQGMGLTNDGVHVQVGWARFSAGEYAALWRGSPESYVNLTPPGARGGRLYATTGTMHCGYANYTGNAEAGVWFGDDPASYINLEHVLGPGWSRSNAKGISVHQGRVYVTGAARSPEGRAEAVLWTARLRQLASPAPQP